MTHRSNNAKRITKEARQSSANMAYHDASVEDSAMQNLVNTAGMNYNAAAHMAAVQRKERQAEAAGTSSQKFSD